MALLYSLTKSKDIYVLAVTQDTSYVLYTVCGTKKTVKETSTVLANNANLFNISTDGRYELVLSASGELDVTENFDIYHNLQNSIILDMETMLECNPPNMCEDDNSCISKGEQHYRQYRDIFVKLLTFQSFYLDAISDSLSAGFSKFLSDAVGLDRCKYQTAINKILNQECLYGSSKGDTSLQLFVEFQALYYYGFYFVEKNLAGNDADELAFIEDKFNSDVIIPAIGEQTCIKEDAVETVFENALNALNTAPTVDNTIITPPNGLTNNLFEYTFSIADFTNNFADVQGDSPKNVKFSILPVRGTFLYDGNPVVVGNEYLVANAALFTYTATINVAQSVFDVIAFQVSDDNLIELYSDMAQVTMNTAGYVNQAISQLGDLTLNKDNRQNHTYTINDFTTNLVPPYVDPEGDSLDAIRVDSLPPAGQLQLNGSPVSPTDIIPATEILAGNFVWIAPDQDASGSNNWLFSARDAGSLQWVN